MRDLITEFLEIETSLLVFAYQYPDSTGLFPDAHCYNEGYLTWHRNYLGLLESWLVDQDGGGKYIPLPIWDPTTPIPDEFFNEASMSCSGSAIAECFDKIKNQNPSGYDFNKFFDVSKLCQYTDGWRRTPRWNKYRNGTAIDNFAFDLQKEQEKVHAAIGGVMNTELASAAAIFWLFHAFLDDIYKKYECECQSRKQKDLYIMDSYVDKGFEPNKISLNFYASPDIWVRNAPDMLDASGRYLEENNPDRHQQLKTGVDNYIYVRVRNIGCSTVEAGEVKLELFASEGNAGGAYWEQDWVSTGNGDNITTSPILLPTIEAGQYHVEEITWIPPNTWKTHACILARLDCATANKVDEITHAEEITTIVNAENNNNIAWRNVDIYCIDPFKLIPSFVPSPLPCYELEIIQSSYSSDIIKLEFAKVDNFNLDTIILSANSGVMDTFLTQGTWQGMNPVFSGTTISHFGIVADTASICDLYLPPGESVTLKLQFGLNCPAGGGFPCAKYGDVFKYDARQYIQTTSGNELLGGNRYEIKIKPEPDPSCSPIISGGHIEQAAHENDPSGLITINTAGPASSYSFYWCHGANTNSVSGLLPGKYEVTVVNNATNCVETACYDLGHLSDLQLEFEVDSISCDGSMCIRVKVSGGTEPHDYTWGNGKKDTFICDIFAGLRSVAITDAQGHMIMRKINLAAQTPLTAFADAACAFSSLNNGLAYIEPIGGHPPYTFSWNTGATTDTISNLSPGDYFATITDTLGCTFIDTVRVESGLSIAPKVFLQGPLNTGTLLMDDDLRGSALLPLTDPYGYGQAVSPSVLSATGSDAILDWVEIEIRDSSSPTTIIQSTAALLQRDGDVVHVDGISPIPFCNLSIGLYHIAIQHRNHLAVMTGTPVLLN